MIIDVLFIIMVTFGFYFGFVFGLIRVVIFLVLFLLAIAASMRFTPIIEVLIKDTFELNSPFLPFVSFAITLIGLLLIVRIMTKLLSGLIDNKRFNRISQAIGGLMMCLVFTFMYSVLIDFFSEAKVINVETQNKSNFYSYIKRVPETGQKVIEQVAPFVDKFAIYMKSAFEALERRKIEEEIDVIEIEPEKDATSGNLDDLESDTTRVIPKGDSIPKEDEQDDISIDPNVLNNPDFIVKSKADTLE
ncbi:MAG: CvpA family protein [Saprospiraceae bacterium]|nr:CvpA family protein [Saprospiraceae bacterium]